MQSFAELEQRVDRALADLPLLGAPDTLLPRVLASVRAWAERPWYQRAWLTWPVGLQAASVALLLLIALGGAMAFPIVQEAASGVLSLLAERTAVYSSKLGASFGVTVNSMVLVWRVLIQPFLPFAVGLAFMAGLVSAALVTALNHVILERSSQR